MESAHLLAKWTCCKLFSMKLAKLTFCCFKSYHSNQGPSGSVYYACVCIPMFKCMYGPHLMLQIHQMADQTVRKVRKQRQVLKRALSELYLNLVLLQNYQQLNHTGFRKILKKHDKLTRSSRGKTVFQEDVSRAYFWTSQTVTDMLVQAEKIMIQTLEQGDRSKAMRRLRVPPLGTEKSSHWTSCTTGLFCGIFLLSIVVVCIAFAMWPSEHYSNQPHLEPTLRAMRAGLVLTLWFFGFAINTYGWRKAGVNHVLIFEFDPRNYLGFMELFAVCLYVHNNDDSCSIDEH